MTNQYTKKRTLAPGITDLHENPTRLPFVHMINGSRSYLINGEYRGLKETNQILTDNLSKVPVYYRPAIDGALKKLSKKRALEEAEVERVNEALKSIEEDNLEGVIHGALNSPQKYICMKRIAWTILGRSKEITEKEIKELRKMQEKQGVYFLENILSDPRFENMMRQPQYQQALNDLDIYVRSADPKKYKIHGLIKLVPKR